MTDEEKEARIALLEDRKEKLKGMMASGIFQSRHGDVSLTFRSMRDLKAAIASINAELRALRGEQRRIGYVQQNGKGY